MSLRQRFSILETYFHEPTFQAAQNLSMPNKLFAYHMYLVSLVTHSIHLFQMCPFPNVVYKVFNAYHILEPESNPLRKEIQTYWLWH